MDRNFEVQQGSPQKRTNLKHGVEIVKLILFNLMSEYFSTQSHPVRLINGLSSTVVNELFSCHNDHTLLLWAVYKEQIDKGIRAIQEGNPDLIPHFTDALLVHFEIQTAELGRPPYDFEATLQNAISRGLFDEKRQSPGTDDFIFNTDLLVKRYGLNS